MHLGGGRVVADGQDLVGRLRVRAIQRLRHDVAGAGAFRLLLLLRDAIAHRQSFLAREQENRRDDAERHHRGQRQTAEEQALLHRRLRTARGVGAGRSVRAGLAGGTVGSGLAVGARLALVTGLAGLTMGIGPHRVEVFRLGGIHAVRIITVHGQKLPRPTASRYPREPISFGHSVGERH